MLVSVSLHEHRSGAGAVVTFRVEGSEGGYMLNVPVDFRNPESHTEFATHFHQFTQRELGEYLLSNNPKSREDFYEDRAS